MATAASRMGEVGLFMRKCGGPGRRAGFEGILGLAALALEVPQDSIYHACFCNMETILISPPQEQSIGSTFAEQPSMRRGRTQAHENARIGCRSRPPDGTKVPSGSRHLLYFRSRPQISRPRILMTMSFETAFHAPGAHPSA